MSDPLDQALADLVDAARKIGEWKAEPAPLTPRERGAWNLRIAELTAAEQDAQQRIRHLVGERTDPLKLPALVRHVEHRAIGGYVRDVSDGPKRFRTLDELDALLAQCGLKSKPYEGPKT